MAFKGSINSLITLVHETGHAVADIYAANHADVEHYMFPPTVAEYFSHIFEEIAVRRLFQSKKERGITHIEAMLGTHAESQKEIQALKAILLDQACYGLAYFFAVFSFEKDLRKIEQQQSKPITTHEADQLYQDALRNFTKRDGIYFGLDWLRFEGLFTSDTFTNGAFRSSIPYIVPMLVGMRVADELDRMNLQEKKSFFDGLKQVMKAGRGDIGKLGPNDAANALIGMGFHNKEVHSGKFLELALKGLNERVLRLQKDGKAFVAKYGRPKTFEERLAAQGLTLEDIGKLSL